MNIKIEGDALIVRVPLDALATATELCPALDDLAFDDYGKPREIKVTDHKVWAGEVLCELTAEREDGTNLLDRAFDRAIRNAVDAGARGISITGII
ncbi:hypothetical protein [Niveispirillum fermenti]|uniref:hypothetical protein n=1 Tax=Niveispirillum fermenti TaxID=1233113 RepID=UPI003A84639B